MNPKTLDPLHDFGSKLMAPEMWPTVSRYIAWRRSVRAARDQGELPPSFPEDIGPLSINLDLTTACNFDCGHCIDAESLHSRQRHEMQELFDSLRELARRGLQSVILIGGGEPTIHPAFVETVRFLKQDLALQVALVSNGARPDRLAEAFPLLESGDWVRLSLDSGTDATFQAMHRPKVAITLEEICQGAVQARGPHTDVVLGFSFVIVWPGAGGEEVVENFHEMELAARLARDHGFDYISFKPFLERADQGAEVLDGGDATQEKVLAMLRDSLENAQSLEMDAFRVIVSTNFRALLDGSWRQYCDQPKECHMQVLRQVVSPLGIFNCPAHRGVEKASLGSSTAWKPKEFAPPQAAAGTANILDNFDASCECSEVVCLYNPVNHLLENWIQSGLNGGTQEHSGAPDVEPTNSSRPRDLFL